MSFLVCLFVRSFVSLSINLFIYQRDYSDGYEWIFMIFFKLVDLGRRNVQLDLNPDPGKFLYFLIIYIISF